MYRRPAEHGDTAALVGEVELEGGERVGKGALVSRAGGHIIVDQRLVDGIGTAVKERGGSQAVQLSNLVEIGAVWRGIDEVLVEAGGIGGLQPRQGDIARGIHADATQLRRTDAPARDTATDSNRQCQYLFHRMINERISEKV